MAIEIYKHRNEVPIGIPGKTRRRRWSAMDSLGISSTRPPSWSAAALA
jgi:hypothetical protein